MARGGASAGDHARGGRGGRTAALPFDIDPELAEQVYLAEENGHGSDDEFKKELFPELPSYIFASPITDSERRGVAKEREIQARRRAGPFWTGTRDEWAESNGRSGGNFDPFEGIGMFGRKRKKEPFQLASLKRVKVCYPQFLPKELQHIVTDSADGTASAGKKKLGLAKKSAVERLAKLDEDETGVDAEVDAEIEDESEEEDNEDDFERDTHDGEWDDPDNDEGNDDYNAEKYFEDGEDDFDDENIARDAVHGDDYGQDDY